MTANLFNNAPNGGTYNGPDLDYQNAGVESYSAMTTHFAGLGAAVSTLTSTAGKTNLDFSNNNYAGPNALFNVAGPTTANYGFSSSQGIEAQFTGFINVLAGGSYTFSTTSDDGNDLFIDGPTNDGAVVANNNFQGATTRTGTVTLTPGLHQIDVGWFQGGGGEGLLVQYSGPDTGGALTTISNAVLVPNANPLALNTIQAYSNNLAVTGNSTIDVNGSLTASFSGGLAIGGNTLNVTSSDATTNPYSLTLNGATTLNGNATFNVANSAGGGPGTLSIGGGSEGPGGPFSIIKRDPARWSCRRPAPMLAVRQFKPPEAPWSRTVPALWAPAA